VAAASVGLGERWYLQLDRMIAASGIFSPLIDESYWKSPYCVQEYETAVRLAEAGRIKIIPCLLDGFDQGPAIHYQGEDLRGESSQLQVNHVVSRLDNVLAAAPEGNTRSRTEPLMAGRTSVDIAIITILEEEYRAVLKLLGNVRQVVGSSDLDNQHAWVVGEASSIAPHKPSIAPHKPKCATPGKKRRRWRRLWRRYSLFAFLGHGSRVRADRSPECPPGRMS
jgi:TIR domain